MRKEQVNDMTGIEMKKPIQGFWILHSFPNPLLEEHASAIDEATPAQVREQQSAAIELRPRDNSIQMPTEHACRRQWIGSSVLRMLKIFSRNRHPEVEGDDITVVVTAIGKE